MIEGIRSRHGVIKRSSNAKAWTTELFLQYTRLVVRRPAVSHQMCLEFKGVVVLDRGWRQGVGYIEMVLTETGKQTSRRIFTPTSNVPPQNEPTAVRTFFSLNL